MNRRLFRKLMRNHNLALHTLLANPSASDAARAAAQRYLDQYPVEEIIRLSCLTGSQIPELPPRRP